MARTSDVVHAPSDRRPWHLGALLLLLAIWAALVVLANARGNFPLMDDWAFGTPIRTLVGTGTLAFPGAGMTLIVHLLWGSAFVLVSHWSYDVLRLSTLVLSAVATVALWRLLLDLGVSRATAVVGTAAFAFNPIVFLLSNTFMTDLPFATWTLLATLAFVRALKRPSQSALVAGILLSIVAVLVRQSGVALPLAFLPAWLMRDRFSWRRLIVAAAPATLAIACLLAYQGWLSTSGHLPPRYNESLQRNMSLGWHQDWIGDAKRALNIGFHASWYLLPIMLWIQPRPATRSEAWRLGGLIAAVAATVLVSGYVAPWGSAVLYDIGIGQPTLHDSLLTASPLPHAPHVVWQIWTVAAAVAGALWARALWRSARATAGAKTAESRVDLAVIALFVGAAALYILPMIVVQFYDRYLLASLPWLIVSWIVATQTARPAPFRLGRVAAVSILILFATFAVVGTHDYFSWNRARWTALARVQASSLYGPREIDGGDEFAHLYWDGVPYFPAPATPARVVVTFGDLAGYRVCEILPFDRWLPPRHDALRLLVPAGNPCPVLPSGVLLRP